MSSVEICCVLNYFDDMTETRKTFFLADLCPFSIILGMKLVTTVKIANNLPKRLQLKVM